VESGGYHSEHIFDIHLHGLEITVYTIPEDISNHTKSLPSRIGESMLYFDSHPTNLSIHLFVLWAERMEFRCFFRCEDTFECDEGTISVSKEVSELPNLHIIGNGTIMFLSFVCFGEEKDSFVFVRDNPVFYCVCLLFSGVGFLLDFVFLRALYLPFASIEKELFEIRIFSDEILYVSNPSLWENNLSSESLLEKRKKLHHPIMSSSFTRTIPEESHHLEREVESYVGEDEEELLSARSEKSLASSSESPLLLYLDIPPFDEELLLYLSEGWNEILEINNRYSRESTEDSRRFHSFFEI
jgi:hypothetical protein